MFENPENVLHNFKLIQNHARKLHQFMENNTTFINYINNLPLEHLNKLYQYYSTHYYRKTTESLSSVNTVRYVLLEWLRQGKEIEVADIKRIQENFENQNISFFTEFPQIQMGLPNNSTTNPFSSWSNFSILFPFYYRLYKYEIQESLNIIADYLLNLLDKENYRYVIRDFSGRRHFGRDIAYIALFPLKFDDFKEAYQIVVRFLWDCIEIGRYKGDHIEAEKLNKPHTQLYINELNEKKIKSLLMVNYKVIDQLNKRLADNQDPDVTLETLNTISETSEEENPLLFYLDTNIDVNAIKEGLEFKKQIILMGPPGTSKSYLAEQLAKRIAKKEERILKVQFHPRYAYEDFIEGREVTGGDTQLLKFNPQLKKFGLFCQKAQQTLEKEAEEKYVVIIDEINRGNVEKIFGELIWALEYRGKPIKMLYSNKDLIIPQNLFIIGTMNTVDLSIVNIDAALRRRFFIYNLKPDEDLLRLWLNEHFENQYQEIIDLIVEFFSELYQFIKIKDNFINEFQAIGHSYFIYPNIKNIDKYIKKIQLTWNFSIYPMILDYHQFDAESTTSYQRMFTKFIEKITQTRNKSINKEFQTKR